ncbi:MAG: DUF167 domain-containing protein [Thermoleophilia bacterium]
METIDVTPSRRGFLVGFRVSPAARRTRVQGVYGDRIKVQVSAPPEDDRANAELISAVAKWLELPADCVNILSGHKRRDKVVAFSGIAERELRLRLQRMLER